MKSSRSLTKIMRKLIWCGILPLLLTLTGVVAGQADLLLDDQDAGFESSRCDGSFPSSRFWVQSWAPASTAGAISTSTAARSGTCGLWTYTGPGPDDSWAGPYQQLPALAGVAYSAQGWGRTPAGQPWVPNSKAFLRILFLNASGEILRHYDSTAITTADSGWQPLNLVTQPAPEGTAYVRFAFMIEKPRLAGQSVANFDDADLSPLMSLSSGALGFGENASALTFTISNPAPGPLNWTLTKDVNWLSVTPSGGSITTGVTTVTVKVNRDGLPPDGHYGGTIEISSNRGNQRIPVYMDTAPSYLVPDQPSQVFLTGTTLYVGRRLPDGTLDAARPFAIKGAAWSPVSIGSPGGGAGASQESRRAEFFKWHVLDLAMMRAMNANTLYTFLDFGTDYQSARLILDNLYRNGLYAILTLDWDGTNDSATIETIVSAYKNHPAILMWAIGNEWNINLYHHKYQSLAQAQTATQAAAALIKSFDARDPVASILGDIHIPPDQPLSVTQRIIADCPSVDVWGLNIYRGADFGNLFEQWASITTKPMFLSEFGADSFITQTSGQRVVGGENTSRQNAYIASQWRDIEPEMSATNPAKVCLGGTVFEWNDEWWKVAGGSPSVQDSGGFPTPWDLSAQPDGFANEEYFGIVGIDRRIKPAYTTLQALFAR